MELKNFDPAAFLRDVWQQKPMLIRQPWSAWHNPLAPDELAGLACEDDVESRLIVGGAGEWSVEQGPVPEQRFAALDARAWTLLVQAVDHHVPEVAALLAAFRFIPNWRIDDVMVSYAADGGGVGPHFDQYDVFLVQGLGRRLWRIGGRCDETTPLLPHDVRRPYESRSRHQRRAALAAVEPRTGDGLPFHGNGAGGLRRVGAKNARGHRRDRRRTALDLRRTR